MLIISLGDIHRSLDHPELSRLSFSKVVLALSYIPYISKMKSNMLQAVTSGGVGFFLFVLLLTMLSTKT